MLDEPFHTNGHQFVAFFSSVELRLTSLDPGLKHWDVSEIGGGDENDTTSGDGSWRSVI